MPECMAKYKALTTVYIWAGEEIQNKWIWIVLLKPLKYWLNMPLSSTIVLWHTLETIFIYLNERVVAAKTCFHIITAISHYMRYKFI